MNDQLDNRSKLIRKCWARKLGCCSNGLTREHVISKGITDEEFQIYYTDDNIKKISTESITIKFLCGNHNSALSAYDSEAQKFIAGIRHCISSKNDPGFAWEGRNQVLLVDGNKLDRWFAKTFFNVAAHKGLVGSFKYPVGDVNSSHIIDYIFGKGVLDSRYGVYQLKPETYLLPLDQNAKIAVAESKYFTNSPEGHEQYFSVPGLLYFQLHGIEFVANYNITQFEDEIRDDIVLGKNYSQFPSMIGSSKIPSELKFSAFNKSGEEFLKIIRIIRRKQFR